MTSFDNALKSDEGNSVYPPDLAKAIFELDIPDRIYLKTAMEFDDKYIVNKGNKWTFDYSGSRRYLVFNQDYISNKLNKYICFKYASTRFPTKLPALHLDWRNIISYCREHGGFSLSTLRLFIEKEDIDNATFYSVLFGLKILCAETFPGFNLED
ncbi:TPA: site-specific integrase, partial [Escherichia coli]